MTIDLTIGDQIKQLRRVGLRLTERLVRTILAAGPAAYRPLLALARDVDLLHEEEPDCFGPLHALRLLGEMPTIEMMIPLLSLLPIHLEYADETLPKSFGSEIPQIIARLGAEGIEPLWGIVGDEEHSVQARGGALIALSYTVAVAPDARDAIVAGLRERLGSYASAVMNTYVAIALGELGVQSAYAEVFALYRDNKIDRALLPAGTARQMLLQQSEGRIACARHPLWERYDQHGPFPPQEAGA